MNALKMAIQKKLRELHPDYDEVVYAYTAIKLVTAVEIGLKKIQDAGIPKERVTKELIGNMVKWAFRLAFHDGIDQQIADQLIHPISTNGGMHQ